MSVVIVGSLNADLFVEVDALPRPGETVRGSELTVRPGGKGANQAVAAARLGARVTMVGAVGSDDHGRLLVDSAAAAGMRTSRIRRLDDAVTGTAVITVDAVGENTIVVSAGANARLTAEDAQVGIADGTAVVGLSLEISSATVEAAVTRAAEVGAMVVLNLSPYRAIDPDVLGGVGVLLVNQLELSQLVGVADEPDDVVDRLARLGVGEVVVTLGGAGAVLLDPTSGTSRRLAAPRVDVVDTTGCGDAFTGGLLSRLAEGAALLGAVETAVRVGAYAATGRGAQPSYPTAQELAGWRA